MANNNVQNVRFLRNGSLFASRELAKSTLSGFTVDNEKDGTAILARYQGDNYATDANDVKTIVGFVYADNSNHKSITIFDIDDVGTDVQEAIDEINTKIGSGVTTVNTVTAQLESLSGTTSDTKDSVSIVGAKKYADDLKSSMDYTGLTVDDNKVVYNVTEADGIVAAEAKNISSVKLAGYTVGSDAKIAATDTLGEALGKLQGQINGMDLTDTVVEGNYVSKVDEADGKITVTRAALPTVAAISETGMPITAVSESLGIISASTGTINAQYVTTSTANTDFTGETVQAALEEISSKVKADKITSADKTITVITAATGTDVAVNIDGKTLVKNTSTGVISSDLKIQKITQSENSEWAAEYQLVYGSSNEPIGEKIQVARDQFLKSATYSASTQTLYLEVQNINGGTTVIPVDFSAAVIEAEAGDGLYVKEDHSLNVGVANDSEAVTTGKEVTQAVLVVGEDSIKVQGIQAAINYKVSTLDADLSGKTTHVTVGVAEADGKLTAVTVTERDIASAQGLADEITARTNADTELSNRLGDGVTTANTASAQLSALSGTSADESGVTSVWGAKKYAQQYADEKVAAVVADLDANVSGNSTHVTVGVTEVNGVITAVSVSESNIANAGDLTDEIAARKAVDGQSGQTYAANANVNYISDATSLNDADVKLDAALKTLDNDAIKSVKVNNKVLAKTSNAVNVQISSTPASETSESPIIVNTDDNGAVTLQISQIDCGTY